MTMVGVCGQLVAQILRSRQAQLLLVLSFVVVNVYLYYNTGQNGTTRHGRHRFHRQDFVGKGPFLSKNDTFEVVEQGKTTLGVADFEINVIIPFSGVERKLDLQKKFKVCLGSILRHTSIPLAFHIVGDVKSWEIAEKFLKSIQAQSNGPIVKLHRMIRHDVVKLARRLDPIIRTMQQRFSYKPGAYYNHALFFLSLALHKVLPVSLSKVIMLDVDLKFNADIKDLFAQFSEFQKSNVIGIAPEMQPVYRHTFQMYRDSHPGTPIGEPLPRGHPGYNSGVLLLDLQRMRQSRLYNDLLEANRIEALTKKYMFKGHLGDQDFFTLISMEHKELFYTLPCLWNRQLCQWWKDKGYERVFDLYHNCTGRVHVYHGNCDTPMTPVNRQLTATNN